MTQDDRELDTLPPALIEHLREMDGPAVMPDATRDADVISGARQHLMRQARPRRPRMKLFITGAAGGAIAAAAMVGIVVLLGEPLADRQASPPMAAEAETFLDQPSIAGDLNADSELNILDAYALAKQIERGEKASATDFNGDGLIDQRDIDWIANQAVALNLGEQG